MGIIAILGGSFNPIHIGHQEIIEQIRNIDDIDKVLIVPTKIPPHKESDYLADANHRFCMCSLIASNYDNVEACDIELKRDGKSYTIDTVNSLLKEYNNCRLALTVGGDMLVSFTNWKDYKDILKNCILITFKRCGISDEEYQDGITKLKEIGAEIISINTEITDVSSTQIREELFHGKNSNLIDTKVKEYIFENNLYGV